MLKFCIKYIFLLLALLLVSCDNNLHKKRLYIAVSSNFIKILEPLAYIFETNNDIKIYLTSNSSGILYNQILHGASFDLFLSANSRYTKLLIEKDLADPNSEFTYAVGKIALVSSMDKITNIAAFLANIKRFAIANPNFAPYGIAAKEFLENAGLWNLVKDKVVYTNNVSMAYSYVDMNNVDGAIVALSQLPKDITNDYFIKLDTKKYNLIHQKAILLNNAKNIDNAKLFLEFLKSKKVQEFILVNNYNLEKAK